MAMITATGLSGTPAKRAHQVGHRLPPGVGLLAGLSLSLLLWASLIALTVTAAQATTRHFEASRFHTSSIPSEAAHARH